MAGGILGNFLRPGYGTEQKYTHKFIFRDGSTSFWPSGGLINVAKTRDVIVSDNTYHLRPGTLMGKITSTGYWANSFFGVTTGALTNTGTSITVTAQQAAEIVRRIGTTGTLTLTAPPTANGTSRTKTVTFSAVDTTTGVVTITALGVNEVQTVNLVTAATAGNLRLIVQKVDGTYALTPNIAWSATDATLLSNANTALDTATGVVGGIVATAIAATDTDLGLVLTYSGTGYAGNTWALAEVHTLFTSNTGSNVVRTTTGVDGRMVAGALVGDTDGSQNPKSLIDGGYGLTLFQDASNAPTLREFPQIPFTGIIEIGQLPLWPSDTGLRAQLEASMSTTGGAKFLFSSNF